MAGSGSAAEFKIKYTECIAESVGRNSGRRPACSSVNCARIDPDQFDACAPGNTVTTPLDPHDRLIRKSASKADVRIARHYP
jgi:hypothetical protein